MFYPQMKTTTKIITLIIVGILSSVLTLFIVSGSIKISKDEKSLKFSFSNSLDNMTDWIAMKKASFFNNSPIDSETTEFEDSVLILKKLFPATFNEAEYRGGNITFDQIFSNEFNSTIIDLSNLKISSIPKPIACRFIKVEELNLSSNETCNDMNKLFEHIPKRKLRKVTIENSPRLKNVFQALSTATKLEELNISKLQDKSDLEQYGSVFINLKRLKFSESSLTKKEFNFFCCLGIKLEFLSLADNPEVMINSSKEEDNASISLPISLRYLDLSNCSELKPAHFKKIYITSNFEELNISKYNFSMVEDTFIDFLFEVNEGEKLLLDSYPLRFGYLKGLNLSDCKIESQKMIEKLFNIRELERLDISDNEIAINFSNIKDCNAFNSLKELNLGMKRNAKKLYAPERYGWKSYEKATKEELLKPLVDFLNQFKLLEILDLSNIKWYGCHSKIFGQTLIDNLVKLTMNECDLKSAQLNNILECKKLKYLEVKHDNFTYFTVSGNFNCQDTLEEVNLSHTNSNDSFFLSLLKCPKLNRLNFECCNISKISTIDMEHTTKSLKYLNISETDINSKQLSLLLNCFALEELAADNNNLDDEVEEGKVFGESSKSLKYLSLIGCKLSDQIVQEINTDFKVLESLFVINAKLKDDIEVSQENFKQAQSQLKKLKIESESRKV